MRVEAARKWWLDRNLLERTAVIVWSVLLLVICIRVSISPRAHSVFPIFSSAGRHWLRAQELYYPYFFDPDLDNFRYSPLAAVLFAPWSALSDRMGNVLWRLFGAGLYFSALLWWARTRLAVFLNACHQGVLFLRAGWLCAGVLQYIY